MLPSPAAALQGWCPWVGIHQGGGKRLTGGSCLPESVLLFCWGFVDLEQLILVLHRARWISVGGTWLLASVQLPAVSMGSRAQLFSHSSAISSAWGRSIPPP